MSDDLRRPDLQAVQADDALLDAIAAGHRSTAMSDDQLAAVLTAWRHDVAAGPVPELMSADEALDALGHGRYTSPWGGLTLAVLLLLAILALIVWVMIGTVVLL